MDTKLKRDLQNANGKTQYDEHAKNVLSNKRILAHILHRVVDEVKDMTIEEIEKSICGNGPERDVPVMPYIAGEQQEDKVFGEGTVYFDLRFTIFRNDTDTKILLDLEAQKSYYPGYEVVTRGVFYCARMISAQADTEFLIPEYDGLKKVYSIWLCFNSPEKIGNAITRYRITKEDILGTTDIQPEAYDKMEIVQIFLNEDAYEHEDELISMLNTVFSTKKSFTEIESSLENEYNITMNDNLREEVKTMCNLSEAIEERGIQKGIKQGIKQGIEQGIEQMVSKLLKSHTSEEVSNLLELPLEQVKKIAKKNSL